MSRPAVILDFPGAERGQSRAFGDMAGAILTSEPHEVGAALDRLGEALSAGLHAAG